MEDISKLENNHSLVRDFLQVIQRCGYQLETDADGWAGLHFAARHNYGELLELLLAQTEVNVNIRTNRNLTPLIWACSYIWT